MNFQPLTTTLNRIRACNPCTESWQRGLAAAGKTTPDDQPIKFSDIATAVGIQDAIWCCCAEPEYASYWRLFAVWCARQVQHLLTNQPSINALDVAERHARGEASDQELAAALAAAWDAAWAAAWADPAAAWAAACCRAAAWDAAWAAAAACCRAAAWDAALGAAANGAAEAAAEDAAQAVSVRIGAPAASAAARDAARATARATTRDAQLEAFIRLCNTGELPEV